jgi:hypothetical protein
LLIDLNEIDDLDKKINFFSYNKFNILSFYNVDHGPRDGSSLSKWVKKNLIKAKINIKKGPIKLLCFPRFFGYVFNPLSIFYCYDENSQLKAILYEVKYTFNEQHTYVFRCKSSSNLILHKCNKKFYVSPFIEMKTFYNFRLLKPGKKLNVLIKQRAVFEKVDRASKLGDQILIQLQSFINFDEPEIEKETSAHEQLSFNPNLLKKVEELELSVRSANCLKNDNIIYIGDLVQKSESEMLRTPNFGRKSLNEIKEVLQQMELGLGISVPDWPPENIEELAKKFEDPFNK